MRDVILGDITEILQKLHERKKEIIKEVEDTKDFYRRQQKQKRKRHKKYDKFAYVEELQNYYTRVMFCRLIYLDIKNSTIYHEKMEKYCEGIRELDAKEIENIRYNDEYREYVILTKNGERYELYEDNLRFIYPMFFRMPNINMAFDGEEFVIYDVDAQEYPF